MTKQTLGNHAIVIGGSIAGLMTARVLADHFDKVTVIERDEPNLVRPEMRKGTPQAAHYHVLLQGGLSLLTELFPGFVDRLNSLGSRSTRAVRDIAYHTPIGIAHSQSGSVKLPRDLGYNVQCQSRPLLEFCIRACALEAPNISIRFGTVVNALIHEAGRVCGVRLGSAEGDAALEADFVIDAGGRGARTPRWLMDLGYEAPEETRLMCDLAYSSIKVRIPEKYRDWPYNLNVFYPPLPNKTGAMMHHIEDGLWHLSLEGRLGAYPPKDAEGFMEFARTFYTPSLYEMVKDAEHVTDVAHFHFHYSLLRHYERLQRFPDGLLVIGDSICSVNPVHGQGMSSSALQVRVLRSLIDECRAAGRGLEGMAPAFFARAAQAVQQPWMLAALKDFQFEGTPGERPEGFENIVHYIGAIEALIGDDAELHQAVSDVMHLIAPMDTLFQEPWKGRVEAHLAAAAQVAA